MMRVGGSVEVGISSGRSFILCLSLRSYAEIHGKLACRSAKIDV